MPVETANQRAANWITPVLKTSANQRDGIEALAKVILDHKRYIMENGLREQKDKVRLFTELRGLIRESLYGQWLGLHDELELQQELALIYERKKSPQEFVKTNVKIALNDSGKNATL